MLDSLLEDIHYHGDNDDIERLIFQVVSKLPEEVQDFAIRECVFISFGNTAAGRTISGEIGYHPALTSPQGVKFATENGRVADFLQSPMWLILLSEPLLIDQMSEQDAQSLIAHEIAHAWSKHDTRMGSSIDKAKEQEVQACDLALEWGFDGLGADKSIQTSF